MTARLYFGSPRQPRSILAGEKVRLIVAPMARFRFAKLVVEPRDLVAGPFVVGVRTLLSPPVNASLNMERYLTLTGERVIAKNELAHVDLRNPTAHTVLALAWLEGEYEAEDPAR